ncbi:MAG TPA: PKD domain-containing protein [Thermoplasmata archaeon]|nr:PKD domain-containing protein [Thermoplasmata archaeon]
MTNRRYARIWSSMIVLGLLALSFSAVHLTASIQPVPGRSLGPGGFPGATELSEARVSLSEGAAPTDGAPLACDSIASTVHCDLAATAAVGAGSTGPGLWANLTTKLASAPNGRVTQMAWDAGDGYVVLYGGYGCGLHCKEADTWSFSNGVWTNLTSTTSGTPLFVYIAGMASDPSTGKVILYGGYLQGSVLSDYTWSYHAGVWTNLSSTVGSTPPARVLPAMATDSTDGEIVMTGGETTNGYNWDTWVFKGGIWTNVTSIAGAAGRLQLPAASDDPAEHGVLLFGEQMTTRLAAATLVYSAGTWHNLTSSLPGGSPSLLAATAGYLPTTGAVIAYSGAAVNRSGTTVYASETWEFANGAWTNVTDLTGTQPMTILGQGSALDPTSGALILFGGDENTSRVPYPPTTAAYTWVLSSLPTVSPSVSKSTVDAGASVTFSAVVTGGFAPNTIAWNFGDGSANSSAASPSHTYSGSGLMVATATATSSVGLSAWATVSVYVGPALSAAPNVSAAPAASTPTYFAAGVSGGTAPFTFAWAFGDGSTSTASDPSHVYAKTGTFLATLKVTDGTGANVTKTLSVVVGTAPPTSVSLSSGTGLGLLLGIVLLLVVVVILAVLLMRKPKSPVMMAPSPASMPPMAPPPPPGPPG